MLQVISLSSLVHTQGSPRASTGLDDVSFTVPKSHLLGVIGAADSGRQQLLELLAGLRTPTGGRIHFQRRDLTTTPPGPGELGHVAPAEDSLSGLLTVRESLMSAHLLRVGGQTPEQRVDKVSHLLVATGLETVAAQRVAHLSAAQRRRLLLALALVSEASLVLCDEMAAGLDVRSQQEMAALLKHITHDRPGRIVIHATEMLGNLAVYDSVLVLHEGRVCFHGPPRALAHYFSISTVEELYPRLAKRPAERWAESWSRHRDSYYDAFQMQEAPAQPPLSAESLELENQEAAGASAGGTPLPGLAAQAAHLLRRRWTLWRRGQREWSEHLALLILCPLTTMLLVASNTGYLSEMRAGNTAPEALWPAAYTCAMVLLTQVLMITLISLRTAFREVAGARALLERERIGGVRPLACLAAALGFLVPLMAAHGAALVLLTDLTGASLPGQAGLRLLLLMLTGVTFGCLCLGISAHSRSPAAAQAGAWKLWAANLLLSGALLGFPRPLGMILQPFLTMHQGWSGSVETLAGLAVFKPITHFVRTWFATPELAIFWLLVQAVVGIALAAWGLRRRSP